MKTATGKAVLAAYATAVKSLQKCPQMSAASHSAGYIIPNGQKCRHKKGFQVFVEVRRFSEELLKSAPSTGGLLGQF